MGAAVVAGVDTPPVFEFAELVLDLVTLAIECRVVRDGHLEVCLLRDAGGDAALCQGMAEPVGIMAPVGQQHLGLGDAFIISAAPL